MLIPQIIAGSDSADDISAMSLQSEVGRSPNALVGNFIRSHQSTIKLNPTTSLIPSDSFLNPTNNHHEIRSNHRFSMVKSH